MSFESLRENSQFTNFNFFNEEINSIVFMQNTQRLRVSDYQAIRL